MNRIKVLKEPKFDKMAENEITKIKGGFCLYCRKATRILSNKTGLGVTIGLSRHTS